MSSNLSDGRAGLNHSDGFCAFAMLIIARGKHFHQIRPTICRAQGTRAQKLFSHPLFRMDGFVHEHAFSFCKPIDWCLHNKINWDKLMKYIPYYHTLYGGQLTIRLIKCIIIYIFRHDLPGNNQFLHFGLQLTSVYLSTLCIVIMLEWSSVSRVEVLLDVQLLVYTTAEY